MKKTNNFETLVTEPEVIRKINRSKKFELEKVKKEYQSFKSKLDYLETGNKQLYRNIEKQDNVKDCNTNVMNCPFLILGCKM